MTCRPARRCTRRSRRRTPAHPAHHGRDLLAGGELAAGRVGDDAGRLDAEHARERHALGQPEPRVQLGAVEAERLDLDQHPAGRRHRDGQLADPQGLGRAGRVQDDRAHGRVILRHRRTGADRRSPPHGTGDRRSGCVGALKSRDPLADQPRDVHLREAEVVGDLGLGEVVLEAQAQILRSRSGARPAAARRPRRARRARSPGRRRRAGRQRARLLRDGPVERVGAVRGGGAERLEDVLDRGVAALGDSSAVGARPSSPVSASAALSTRSLSSWTSRGTRTAQPRSRK